LYCCCCFAGGARRTNCRTESEMVFSGLLRKSKCSQTLCVLVFSDLS
jgi:hypothetical protein